MLSGRCMNVGVVQEMVVWRARARGKIGVVLFGSDPPLRFCELPTGRHLLRLILYHNPVMVHFVGGGRKPERTYYLPLNEEV